jgi:hypothetical protein
VSDLTLEDVFTGHSYGDVDASALQLAICRAVQARPLDGIIDEGTVLRHFGTEAEQLAHVLPTLVVLACGVRAGKSWLASCAALHATLTADLSRLKPHELPRFAIVGPDLDAATATFTILKGIVESSPLLRSLLATEPSTDTLVIRRPDGRRVEICVVAAARGGRTVRNRWLVGFILEEVAQIGVEIVGAAVNAEEILRAAETRLLPGCQGLPKAGGGCRAKATRLNSFATLVERVPASPEPAQWASMTNAARVALKQSDPHLFAVLLARHRGKPEPPPRKELHNGKYFEQLSVAERKALWTSDPAKLVRMRDEARREAQSIR